MADDRLPPAHDALLADLAHAGCPLCRAARRGGDAVLTRLLTESTTDPDTRIRLRAAGGVCPEHAARVTELAIRRVDAQPVATLANDLLERVTAEAGRGWRRARRVAGCQVCEAVAPRVDAYLDLLAYAPADSEVGRAARQADRGICSAHLRRALRRRRRPVAVRRLTALHGQVADPLRAELDAYRRAIKDPEEELSDRVATAWRRAWEWAHGTAPPR